MRKKLFLILQIFLVSLGLYLGGYFLWRTNFFFAIYTKITGRKTVEDILSQYEGKVKEKLVGLLEKNNTPYPLSNLTLLAFKAEQVLELWTISNGKPVFIKKYPFTTTSGKQGPKLKRGDGQIPEGFYKIESLNPNSAFHLSLKINFPNEFDLEKAKLENRNDPGDNIFIHGKDKSIGCIAIGDEAIEELFVLAAKARRSGLDVIIFPYDMRNFKYNYTCDECPTWTEELYNRLKQVSHEFSISK